MTKMEQFDLLKLFGNIFFCSYRANKISNILFNLNSTLDIMMVPFNVLSDIFVDFIKIYNLGGQWLPRLSIFFAFSIKTIEMFGGKTAAQFF